MCSFVPLNILLFSAITLSCPDAKVNQNKSLRIAGRKERGGWRGMGAQWYVIFILSEKEN